MVETGPLPLGGGIFHRASGHAFNLARDRFVAEQPDFAHYLTPYAATVDGFAFLTDDGSAGFLLFEDGEIANLFAHGWRGLGEVGLIEAIERGGDRVEFFDEMHLWALYARHGFTEVQRLPFNDEIIRRDFPAYDFEKHGRPDYVIAHRDAEGYVRRKRLAAYDRARVLHDASAVAKAEAIMWTEKLRDLVGPARDERTPEQRLQEGW